MENILPKSRSEAKLIGSKWYFTNRPCKRNHMSERRTTTGICEQCKIEIDAKYRSNNKDIIQNRDAEYYSKNKNIIRVKHKKYYENNKDAFKKRKAKYNKDNKELVRKYNAKHHKENKEHYREYFATWYPENKHKVYASVNARRARKSLAMPLWANKDIIAEIYKECRKISKETNIKHHVDHIIPLKNNIVCGLHCEDNLHIIPAIENLEKSNNFYISP